jgi:hypothetical protein
MTVKNEAYWKYCSSGFAHWCYLLSRQTYYSSVAHIAKRDKLAIHHRYLLQRLPPAHILDATRQLEDSHKIRIISSTKWFRATACYLRNFRSERPLHSRKVVKARHVTFAVGHRPHPYERSKSLNLWLNLEISVY